MILSFPDPPCFLISSTFREWNIPFIYAPKTLLIYFVMISFLSLASNPGFRLEIDLKLLAEKDVLDSYFPLSIPGSTLSSVK